MRIIFIFLFKISVIRFINYTFHMIKIKSIREAETGDLIKNNRMLCAIKSIQEMNGSFMIGLENGELLKCAAEERTEIFRFVNKP